MPSREYTETKFARRALASAAADYLERWGHSEDWALTMQTGTTFEARRLKAALDRLVTRLRKESAK